MILKGSVGINNNQVSLRRGSFIEEMSFLSQHSTSADVICNEDLQVIEWNNVILNNVMIRKNIIWIKLQNVFLLDLILKIKNS